jgi:serine/threonine protein kinase
MYIHRKEVVHRDLNPRNVFVSEKGICKIADFGEAAEMGPAGVIGFHGTRSYMAPEVMRQARDGVGDDQFYGKACDIWSLGIVLMGEWKNNGKFLEIKK